MSDDQTVVQLCALHGFFIVRWPDRETGEPNQAFLAALALRRDGSLEPVIYDPGAEAGRPHFRYLMESFYELIQTDDAQVWG